MNGPPEHAILLVDDEVNILHALKRVLRKEPYRILTATSGEEGLRLLEQQPVAVVCSDQRMPGMSGVAFLAEVRRRWPQTLRILLTGYADIQAAMDAINRGEVYRFLSKPWKEEELRLLFREAVERYALEEEVRRLHALTQKQNEELRELNAHLERRVEERTREIQQKNQELARLYRELEQNFTDFIKVFMGLVELKSPYLGSHSKRVAALARHLAEYLNLSPEEALDVEIAALLMDIGTIGFPEKMLRKQEEDMDTLERALMRQHPVLGQDRLLHIQRLQRVAILIRHHHERFDGRGYPDRLRGEEIPLGARIIAIADAYDGWVRPPEFSPGCSPERAMHRLEQEAGSRFDPALVRAFVASLERLRASWAQAEEEEEILEVGLEQLKEGMVLAEDLKTDSGLLLMTRGETIRQIHLEKLRNFHRIDPIVSRIRVFREAPGIVNARSQKADKKTI